jgi:hypothetical protein
MVEEPSHVKQLSLNHVCKIGLKGDLSNVTTFNPPLFSLVDTFKLDPALLKADRLRTELFVVHDFCIAYSVTVGHVNARLIYETRTVSVCCKKN